MSVLKIKISNNGSPNKAAQENLLKPEKVRIEKYRADRRTLPNRIFLSGILDFSYEYKCKKSKR
jgi:hypothetical protein